MLASRRVSAPKPATVRTRLMLAASSKLTNTQYTAAYTNTGIIARIPRLLYQDNAYLKMDFFNFMFPPDVQTNAIQIDECALEYNGSFVPVTFSGASGVSMAAETSGYVSDPIYPWKFGVSVFPAGAIVYLRYRLTIPAGGKLPGCGSASISTQSVSNFYRFYNKDTTTVSPVMSIGSMSVLTGVDSGIPNGDNGTGCLEPVLVGLRNSTSSLPAVMVVGDSLMDGQPSGYVTRAAVANSMACLEFSHGSRSQTHLNTSAPWLRYMSYASEFVDGMGTNDLDNPTGGFNGYWQTAIVTYGITGLYYVGQYPRSSQAVNDGFTTANQTPYFPDKKLAFDNFIAGKLSNGTLRGWFKPNSIRNSPSDYLWLPGATANLYTLDGIHATALGDSMVAAEFAPIFAGWMSGRLAPTT